GFGADLGAEKFLDIKCRYGGLKPDAVVLVATVRALKYNGGVKKDALKEENLDALKKGICNLEKHICNMKQYGVPVLVALNVFDTDTEAEIGFVQDYCAQLGAPVARSEVFARGGEGGIELAELLCETLDTKQSNFAPVYDLDCSIKEKINAIVTKIYGGDGVEYDNAANRKIAQLEELGFGNLPVCMAKTQYSLSDDPALLGAPSGFTVRVRDVNVSAGAGFIVALTGDIMTMPGLPKVPAADNIDIDENGEITGLF
ncbi:MAG: formate--tetrahydrofolate ligase, partial [Ruminococcaceae bacterium]|nr:formate--tetrahydrofolate ligase [Oscillospiraceae bacterium]